MGCKEALSGEQNRPLQPLCNGGVRVTHLPLQVLQGVTIFVAPQKALYIKGLRAKCYSVTYFSY